MSARPLHPTITPTPTDVYYEVRANDDMGGIAYFYGISVADLMTANPDVDPRAMVVGMQLLIPITPSPPPTTAATSESAQATAAPTEEELTQAAPDCYLDGLGGMWCFALYENNSERALENVSAVITLGEGDEARQEKRPSRRSTCCLPARRCPWLFILTPRCPLTGRLQLKWTFRCR